MSDGKKPASGPGGGGGGAGSETEQGGAGYAGKVAISYTGSTSPATNVFRFILSVPEDGGTNGTVLLRALTDGTVAKIEVIYLTGGNLQCKGYDDEDNEIYDSTSLAAGVDDTPMMISVELTTSNGDVNIAFRTLEPGDSVTTLDTGSVSGSVGNVTTVTVNPGGTETKSVGVGHLTVQYALVALSNLSDPLAAYAGELAADRFTRLCTEEGVDYTLSGTAADTPEMGPQPDTDIVGLLQECEDVDRGLLYETRDKLGLGYRTRVNLQNQTAVASLDYSAGHLSEVPEPVDDDQLTRNKVTISRSGGSSAQKVLETGDLSIQPPPNGVGVYPYSQTVNCHSDDQLAELAQWLLELGTVDEFRWPSFEVNLIRDDASGEVFADVPALIDGDYFTMTNPPDFVQSQTVKQLAVGFTETLNAFTWRFRINAVPESPYEGENLPDW